MSGIPPRLRRRHRFDDPRLNEAFDELYDAMSGARSVTAAGRQPWVSDVDRNPAVRAERKVYRTRDATSGREVAPVSFSQDGTIRVAMPEGAPNALNDPGGSFARAIAPDNGSAAALTAQERRIVRSIMVRVRPSKDPESGD